MNDDAPVLEVDIFKSKMKYFAKVRAFSGHEYITESYYDIDKLLTETIFFLQYYATGVRNNKR